MITTGQPALLPWTSPALLPLGQLAYKPRAGNAPLSAGKSFARAVASVPSVKVAALDVASGYLVASADLTLRDDLLALLAADADRTVYWYEVAPSDVPTHAYFVPVAACAGGSVQTGEFFGEALTEGHSATWSLPSASAWTFGELFSLGERIDAWLARTAGAIEAGEILFFGGTGNLQVPFPDRLLTIALPALAMYGVFADPATVSVPRLENFAKRLVCASPFAPASASLFAAVADRETFRTAAWPAAFPAEPWDSANRWPARREWLSRILSTDRLESGNLPAWMESSAAANMVEATAAHLAAGTPPTWMEENDEPFSSTSQFSLDEVPIEFDNT
jgi:hypothetical protein